MATATKTTHSLSKHLSRLKYTGLRFEGTSNFSRNSSSLSAEHSFPNRNQQNTATTLTARANGSEPPILSFFFGLCLTKKNRPHFPGLLTPVVKPLDPSFNIFFAEALFFSAGLEFAKNVRLVFGHGSRSLSTCGVNAPGVLLCSYRSQIVVSSRCQHKTEERRTKRRLLEPAIVFNHHKLPLIQIIHLKVVFYVLLVLAKEVHTYMGLKRIDERRSTIRIPPPATDVSTLRTSYLPIPPSILPLLLPVLLLALYDMK